MELNDEESKDDKELDTSKKKVVREEEHEEVTVEKDEDYGRLEDYWEDDGFEELLKDDERKLEQWWEDNRLENILEEDESRLGNDENRLVESRQEKADFN